ncbi:MAG: tripartite tricarboxylate transporter TctB family protein [Betaproteobacteria bacterium]|nr:tripartite tricarboxylate transporter TctB family protein [Betaproteobacteria bacterium]
MTEKFRLPEVWCKIALLFVFGAFYILAIPFPQEARQFPQLLASFSLVLTVIALIADFSRRESAQGEILDVGDTELKFLDAKAKKARRKRYYQAWAIILASTGIGFLGGFLYSTVCLFAGFGAVFGRREKLVNSMITALAMTVVVYLVFGRAMGVPLLEGII